MDALKKIYSSLQSITLKIQKVPLSLTKKVKYTQKVLPRLPLETLLLETPDLLVPRVGKLNTDATFQAENQDFFCYFYTFHLWKIRPELLLKTLKSTTTPHLTLFTLGTNTKSK